MEYILSAGLAIVLTVLVPVLIILGTSINNDNGTNGERPRK